MLTVEYEKNCRNCIYRKTFIVNGDILCKYKGVVSPEFSCRRFSYDIFTSGSKKKRILDMSFNEKDFEI